MSRIGSVYRRICTVWQCEIFDIGRLVQPGSMNAYDQVTQR